jgi:hypothetical protein
MSSPPPAVPPTGPSVTSDLHPHGSPVEWTRSFLKRQQAASESWRIVVRDTAVVVGLLALTLVSDLATIGVLTAIGALNVLLAEQHQSIVRRLRWAIFSAGVNAAAFGAGSLIGLTGDLMIPLLGGGILLTQLINLHVDGGRPAMVASVMLAFGVGLPGDAVAVALLRSETALAGGAVAVAAIAVLWLIGQILARETPSTTLWEDPAFSEREGGPPGSHYLGVFATFDRAWIVGVVCAVGLTIGLVLGLPRDYWVVLTIVAVFQASYTRTMSIAVARSVGTVIGAALAGGVILLNLPVPVTFGLLSVSAALIFSMRSADIAFYTVFLTVFIILLFDLVYPGPLLLAYARVIDTIIGSVLAVVSAGAVRAFSGRVVQPRGGSPARSLPQQ